MACTGMYQQDQHHQPAACHQFPRLDGWRPRRASTLHIEQSHTASCRPHNHQDRGSVHQKQLGHWRCYIPAQHYKTDLSKTKCNCLGAQLTSSINRQQLHIPTTAQLAETPGAHSATSQQLCINSSTPSRLPARGIESRAPQQVSEAIKLAALGEPSMSAFRPSHIVLFGSTSSRKGKSTASYIPNHNTLSNSRGLLHQIPATQKLLPVYNSSKHIQMNYLKHPLAFTNHTLHTNWLQTDTPRIYTLQSCSSPRHLQLLSNQTLQRWQPATTISIRHHNNSSMHDNRPSPKVHSSPSPKDHNKTSMHHSYHSLK
ncbi:hypothetical protein Nepgr_014838 [Nepenthes gracilis]|uniref:Uncharacterized protein n=1 Tax=Nepenthes gracilis TaxID=150966 RepID=A0AAD3SKT2_NEPGR|nr:hypothetical protein Nepgr_014838 [Nepenthes gracilis]